MVGTKHCCLCQCKRDSRYADKWPKLLRVRGIRKKSIHTFSKTFVRHGKVQGSACSREFFVEKNITRSTYVCAIHWPGESSFIHEECVHENVP